MERLGQSRPHGLTASALRVWGILFLVAGLIGRGILQNRILNISNATMQQMLDALSATDYSMTVATVSLILQGMEVCAIPIFALLLAEGFRHTKDLKIYLLRVAAVALVSEVLYDLVMANKVLDMTAQNPCIGLVLGMVVLYLYSRFAEPTASHRLLKVFILIMAIVWAEMLRIDHGTPIVVLTAVFWLMRNRPNLRGLVGAGICMCCTVISTFYLAASLGCLPAHMYNGEQGEGSKVANYLAYPLLLLVIYLIGTFAL